MADATLSADFAHCTAWQFCARLTSLAILISLVRRRVANSEAPLFLYLGHARA